MDANIPAWWATDHGSEGALAQAIPLRFAEAVRAAPPDHLAYVWAGGSLTYAELDRQSDHLAGALCDVLGSGGIPGKQRAVALLLPNAPPGLIGMLGVLKSGHFYVPLASEHGASHHIRVTSDCPPDAWVTTSALLSHCQMVRAEINRSAPVILVDDLRTSQSTAMPVIEIPSQASAMVVYTSGTTGQPRGVLRTHEQVLANAVLGSQDLALSFASRVAHVYSVAFGMAQTILCDALLNGATLCAYPLHEGTFSGLHRFLLQEEVTAVRAITSTLRGLVAAAEGQELMASLTAVTIGGETTTPQDVASLLRVLPPGCRLVIHLASSETGTYAHHFLEAGKPWTWKGDRVPAGYAPPGVEVMVVDGDRRPLPPGVEGEIAVRSRYLTPGYWNRPELNATRFLPDPDGGDRRIFLTGDRGRIGADGLLEHLGRMDFMVKVRGHRVEPETVELALMAHPNLYECVVVARPGHDGGSQLVAYLVARQEPSPTVPELRAMLLQTLAGYMVPSRFVFLERLPRNANNKVDRSALPPPGATRPVLDTAYVAPRNDLEQEIADLWAELLELDEVGVEDSFIELGGDSLLALRMLLQVERQTGTRAPAAYFQKPTVAHLARLAGGGQVEQEAAAPGEAALAAGEARGRGRMGGGWVASGIHQRGPLILRGPLLGGIALPYGVGVVMQRAWLQTPGLAERVFPGEISLLQRWGEVVGEQVTRNHILVNLLANTWREWRVRVLNVPLGSTRWVSVRGDPALWQPDGVGQGAIFLSLHSPVGRLFTRGLVASGVKVMFIQGVSGETATPEQDHAAQVYRAYQALERGEVVGIAADGVRGKKGVSVPFFGGQREFRQGGAELAVQTGAKLVPVFATMTAGGQVQIEVCAALEAGEGSANLQVERLTQTYGELVASRWPQVYPSLDWRSLSGALEGLEKQRDAAR